MTLTLEEIVTEPVDFDNALKYRIVNFEIEKTCSILNYTNIVSHTNLPGNINQDWRIIKLIDGNFEIMSVDPEEVCRGKSFTFNGERHQVTISPWRFSGNPDQRWIIEKINGTDQCIIKTVSNPQLVLTIKDCSSDEDAIIFAESYTGRECQKWRIVKT